MYFTHIYFGGGGLAPKAGIVGLEPGMACGISWRRFSPHTLLLAELFSKLNIFWCIVVATERTPLTQAKLQP